MDQIGIVKRSVDSGSRIFEEKYRLKLLRNRDDFLSLYNEVVRYMFILCLMEGYDIRQDKVHSGLRIFLAEYLCYEDEDMSDLVIARHSKKYKGSRPSIRMRMLLSRVRNQLSTSVISSS